MKIKNIEIEKDTLNAWIKTFPAYDLFFFPAKGESLMDGLGSNALIMTRKEFSDHNSFNQIDMVNSYQYWNIRKEAVWVCATHPEVMDILDDHQRKTIFKIQKEVNRGLLFEWSFVYSIVHKLSSETVKEIILQQLSSYLFEYESTQYISLQSSLWHRLDDEFKIHFLLQLAEAANDQVEIEQGQIQAFTEQYPHLSPFFNLFPSSNGANCLAAVLAGISGKTAETNWLISLWVHDDGFLMGLKKHQYEWTPVSAQTLEPEDVLVWKNEKGFINHASYYLGNGYFFNKNGQSFFNPWQLVSIEALCGIWGKERIEVYRRAES